MSFPIHINSLITQGLDNRPLAIVKIKDRTVTCLLDSGSNSSIAGPKGIELLIKLGYTLHSGGKGTVFSAGKMPHQITGAFKTPCEFQNRVETIDFLACPTIQYEFILGVDFWSKFEMKVQNVNGTWHCSSIHDEIQPNSTSPPGIVDMEHLDSEQRTIALKIINEFQSLVNENGLGRTNVLTQDIDTGDAEPTVQRLYRVAPSVQERMSKELDRMIEMDVVEPSRSPWRSPIVLVKKANGKDRLCIDSRKVNSVTVFDSYPLPHISSILDNLGQTKYLSSIDLKDAFWQIPLTKSAREKTAFVVPGRGLWQMKVVPFGMKNSAQAMQRLVDRMFSGEEGIFTYLDDIIIVTETFDEHIELLNLALERLSEANLTINYDKCQFFRPSLKYLGFIVDVNGLHTDPKKVEAIGQYPIPKNSTEVKRFMGMASWYRRFVKDFASIAAPIHEVTAGIAKGKPIKWTDSAQIAFNKLKYALSNSPVLVMPDFSKPFVVHCDASNTGVGAVLSQGPEEAPIAFASRKLGAEHKNYTTTEKECFAVLFGIEQFRPYIEGTRFTVVTDHSALKWLIRQQNLPDRLSRWLTKIQQHTFEVVHRKGSSNLVPDALSRCHEKVVEESVEVSIATIEDVCVLECTADVNDIWYNKMLEKCGDPKNNIPQFTVRNSQLFIQLKSRPGKSHPFTFKKVVPQSWIKRVLDEGHSEPTSAHLGIAKTRERILQRYFWPKMSRDIKNYVRQCTVCIQSKTRQGLNNQGLMGKFKFANAPFQMISLDFVGPLPRTTLQNTVILVITDWFTKMVSLFALRQAKANKVVEILEKRIFLEYGVPEIVIMDNGRQFVSKELMTLFDKYRISKVWFNSYYHPQNNFTERYNKTLGNCLRAFSQEDHRHWDAKLHEIQLALRTAIHDVTGFSPFYLNFGREYVGCGNDYKELRNADEKLTQKQYCSMLTEFQKTSSEVQSKMKRAYEKNAKYYNRRRVAVSFDVGDTVYRRTFGLSNASHYICKKLLPKYIPLKISKKVSDLTYELVDETNRFVGKFHVQDFFKIEPTS